MRTADLLHACQRATLLGRGRPVAYELGAYSEPGCEASSCPRHASSPVIQAAGWHVPFPSCRQKSLSLALPAKSQGVAIQDFNLLKEAELILGLGTGDSSLLAECLYFHTDPKANLMR